MMEMRTVLAALLLCAVAVTAKKPCPGRSQAALCSQVEAGIALGQTHSHNTYDQPGGLRDALAAGFCSFEADFFYNGSALWIAHDQENIWPDWTMQSKYLDALVKVIKANEGDVYPASRVFGGCKSIILLCDAKEYNDDTSEEAARKQFDALEAVLRSYQAKHPGMFTIFNKDGSTVPGAINAYVSGLRPSPDYVAAKDKRPLALDGRLINLDNQYGPSVYPLISQGFTGVCPAPPPPDGASEAQISKWQVACMIQYRSLIRGYINAAHKQHRIIRFWETSDTPAMWSQLIDARLDLVNVDKLQQFRAYAFEQWGPRSALEAYERKGKKLRT